MNLKLLLSFLLLCLTINFGMAQEKSYFTSRNTVQVTDSIKLSSVEYMSLLNVLEAFKPSQLKKTIHFFVKKKESIAKVEKYKGKTAKRTWLLVSETLNDRIRLLSLLWILLTPFFIWYIIVKSRQVFIKGIENE